jgi:hypothetical protein
MEMACTPYFNWRWLKWLLIPSLEEGVRDLSCWFSSFKSMGWVNSSLTPISLDKNSLYAMFHLALAEVAAYSIVGVACSRPVLMV